MTLYAAWLQYDAGHKHRTSFETFTSIKSLQSHAKIFNITVLHVEERYTTKYI